MEDAGKSILDRWYRKQSLVRKLFAPGNFRSVTEIVGVENFTCRRATTDFLRFSQSESAEELTLQDRARYSNDVTLLDYMPTDFKNETVQVVVDEQLVNCRSCSGQGRNPCPPYIRCQRCAGQGGRPCDPEMACRTCSGTRQVVCSRCQGNGRISEILGDVWHTCPRCRGRGKWSCGNCLSQFGVPIGRVRCDMCMGSGWEQCARCGGGGELVCSDCKGQGYLLCQRCDASGQMVYAGIVTNTFTPTRSVQFLPQSKNPNGLKNGIASHHISSMPGKMVSSEYQNSTREDVVLQKLMVEDFDVSSHQFQYLSQRFFVNHIMGANGRGVEVADTKLPLSGKKIAIVLGISALALGVTVATMWLASYL